MPPVPKNVTVFEDKPFKDVINVRPHGWALIQVDASGGRAFKERIQLKRGPEGRAHILTAESFQEERERDQECREKSLRGHRERVATASQGAGPQGGQTCRHLGLGFLDSRTGKTIHFCGLRLPGCGRLLGSPRKPIQMVREGETSKTNGLEHGRPSGGGTCTPNGHFLSFALRQVDASSLPPGSRVKPTFLDYFGVD